MSGLPASVEPTAFGDYHQRSGIVLSNTAEIGKVEALGSITVGAREVIDIDDQIVNYRVTVDLKPSGEYASEVSTEIPYDDVDAYVAALTQLRKLNPAATKFAKFGASYSPKHGPHIMIFTAANGALVASVAHGGASAFLRNVADLERLEYCLVNAKKYIDANRTLPPG